MKTLLASNSIDGLEALSISERMKLFFTDVSTGIDKMNAAIFNSSIHTVEYKGVVKNLKEHGNYFEYSTNQIPTPVFFNPEKTSFREYTSFCLSALGLLQLVENETDRLNNAFRRIAASGEVPFNIRHWDMQKTLDDVKSNMDKNFFSTNKTTQTINVVYRNAGEIDDTFKYFNDTVKSLKSRDVEVVTKKINNFIDLIKLIKRKVDVGDLKFSSDDTMTMECAIQRLSELVSASGLIMSRLNELTRVLELHVDELRRYVK